MNLSLNLTGALGTSLTVHLENEAQVLPTLRKYGAQGWTSGEIPAGGLVLPLAMADSFDWALIGARPYTTSDGEQAVMYRGQSYKRRDLDEVDTKKLQLPRVVKFSRGARPTDPAHLKEGEAGGVQYITLLSFRGNGRVIEAYLDPSTRSPQLQQQAQLAAPVQELPVLRKEMLGRLQAACRVLGCTQGAVLAGRKLVQFDDLDLTRMVLELEGRNA